jgi:hypothetical protein
MSVSEQSLEAVITVQRMAELCSLSRSRFHDLVAAGVFPKPIQHPTSRRPMYDRALQEKCLEIRRTGIGANGVPVLFNRRAKQLQTPKKAPAPVPVPQKREDLNDLLDSLRGLGLSPTEDAVSAAVAAEFPQGHQGVEPGDLVRKVFLRLQQKRR